MNSMSKTPPQYRYINTLLCATSCANRFPNRFLISHWNVLRHLLRISVEFEFAGLYFAEGEHCTCSPIACTRSNGCRIMLCEYYHYHYRLDGAVSNRCIADDNVHFGRWCRSVLYPHITDITHSQARDQNYAQNKCWIDSWPFIWVNILFIDMNGILLWTIFSICDMHARCYVSMI